jgi:hypothetical protein
MFLLVFVVALLFKDCKTNKMYKKITRKFKEKIENSLIITFSKSEI